MCEWMTAEATQPWAHWSDSQDGSSQQLPVSPGRQPPRLRNAFSWGRTVSQGLCCVHLGSLSQPCQGGVTLGIRHSLPFPRSPPGGLQLTTVLGMGCTLLPGHLREPNPNWAQQDENVCFYSLLQGIQGTGMRGN